MRNDLRSDCQKMIGSEVMVEDVTRAEYGYSLRRMIP